MSRIALAFTGLALALVGCARQPAQVSESPDPAATTAMPLTYDDGASYFVVMPRP